MTTDSTLQAEAEAPAYAVRLDIEHPANQRRLTNFPLFIGTILRFVLLTPHLLMLSFLVYAQYLAYFMATFVILFRGRYPVGLFKFQVSVLRWQANVTAYYRHLFDEYPPLDMDQRPDRALRFEVDYPVQPSRWLNMPLLGILIKLTLTLPHLLILYALGLLASVVVFIAELVILFNKTFPAGLHQLVVGYLRWSNRVYGYLSGFTDKYPPFSLS